MTSGSRHWSDVRRNIRKNIGKYLWDSKNQKFIHGFVQEAYTELKPFIERVLTNKGFFEWYSINGKPSGTGNFRGSADVLYTAITNLQRWAAAHE